MILNLFKKKNKSSALKIECNSDAIKINGNEITFPTNMGALINLFGEPSVQEHHTVWYVAWDNYGVYCNYGSSDNILSLNILIKKIKELKHTPKQLFNGQLLVNNTVISKLDFAYNIELVKNTIYRMRYKGEGETLGYVIGWNPNYQEEIPKDKYKISPPKEACIVFKDFGFKLSIIQELMYNKDLLKPKFDLFEFVAWYSKRKIDLEEEGYAPISEVTQYFKDLPIPKRFASAVTEIYQDGGNEIYLQLLRFGEGWETYWDIENIEDLVHFSNLKEATLCYAKDSVLKELNDKGIKATWL